MPKGTGIVYLFEARTRSTVGTHSESVAVLVVRRMVAAVGAWAQRTRLRSQRREASRKLCAPPKIPKVKLLRHRISLDSSLVSAGVCEAVNHLTQAHLGRTGLTNPGTVRALVSVQTSLWP